MRCLYREKKIYCGANYLEVHIYPVFKKGISRREKSKPSTDIQAMLNQRNAEKRLTWLMNTNFTSADLELHLSYTINPESAERAKKDLQNFLRRVKRLRKKLGLPELKYIAVTERGKSEGGRYHHHVTLNGGIDRDELEKLWGLGFSNTKRLQFNETGVAGLARYIVKEPVFAKRWCASKNLSKPKESTNDHKFSARKANDLKRDREVRERFETLYPGYFFADCEAPDNDYNNGTYLCIRMYKKGVRLM